MVINKYVKLTLHYEPNHPLVVHQGQWITLTDQSNDIHTFSLVAAEFIPSDTNSVLNCGTGAPGLDICTTILAAHTPGGPPNGPPPTPPYPPNCIEVGAPPQIFQCIEDGTGVPNGGPFPTLDKSFTLSQGGDSVILLPGETILMQVTAPPGTVLHFMCAFHPWMQGEIVVVPTED